MSEETLGEEETRTMLWQNTDTEITRSIHAYLAWHSGAVFRTSITDRPLRTEYLDRRADEALSDACRLGFDTSDPRRLLSMRSLDTQTQHDIGDQPVVWLDVEMIDEGFALPAIAPSGLTFEPIVVGYPRYDSYLEFRAAYKELAYFIKHYPGEVDYQLTRLQRDYLQVSNYNYQQEVDSFHFIPPEFHITGIPDDRVRTITQMNPSHDLGKLISLSGQVVEISEYKTKFTTIAWKCKDYNCREVHFVEQDEYMATITKPEPSCGKYHEMQYGESNGCNSKHFERLPPPMSNAISVQRLILQEEDIVDGETKSMTVEVRGSMVDSVLAGQGVEVIGILHSEPVGKGLNLERKMIMARSITEKSNQLTNITVTEEDRSRVERFVEEYNYADRMSMVVKEWGGRVYSEDHIKEAIILQSCGGVKNGYSKTSGRIHILIVGDPGTAKTKLLELATEIHPGSRFVQADVASQAGLFGACVQAEDLYTGKKQWTITPGELPLAHEYGVCAVDEFNLYKGDKSEFNNAMESGYIKISKVQSATLKTPAPIIAGANPMNGNKKKWIRGERVPYTEQIGLDFAMLQRFSLIFVLEDTPDEERDRNIALSMIKGISQSSSEVIEEAASEIDIEFIQKYLSIAREFNPVFTTAAGNYMATQHAQQRQSTDDDDELRSHRQLNSLWRLASAIAKFDLSETVTLEHIKRAELIIGETLTEKDPGLFTTGVTKADRELERDIKEAIITFFAQDESDTGKTASDLHNEVSKSISSYRKPSLNEFTEILNLLSDGETNGFTKAGEMYFKLE